MVTLCRFGINIYTYVCVCVCVHTFIFNLLDNYLSNISLNPIKHYNSEKYLISRGYLMMMMPFQNRLNSNKYMNIFAISVIYRRRYGDKTKVKLLS